MEKKIRNKWYLRRLGDNAHKLYISRSAFRYKKSLFISDDIIFSRIMIMIIVFLLFFKK